MRRRNGFQVQPPPDPIPNSPPPPGFVYLWVEETDRDWQAIRHEADRKICRRPGCGHASVARLRRSNGWWHYCGDHLYGRRYVGGVLFRRALREESPAR